MPKFIKSLKFQIGLALFSLVSLFFYFSLYTLSVLEEQRSYATLLRLAGELKVTYQHMAMQAMNYHENAPRDYDTYARDLKLYYQDLMVSTEKFGAVCEAFSSGHFSADLTLTNEFMAPELGENTREAAQNLEEFWQIYSHQLMEKLGTIEDEPRLEWAAEHISNESVPLETRTNQLLTALESDILVQTRQTNTLVRVTFIFALLLTLGIMLWFYLQVLKPLGNAVHGFRKVATGDFGYKVDVSTDNEIGWMTESFNHLSGRLDAIFGLSTRLQQGSNLDETLAYVSTALPELLPMDWVGALMVIDDDRIQLERAYSHGQREQLPVQSFALKGSLLQECLNSGEPLHIPDLTESETRGDGNTFIDLLIQRNRREAIFMPVTEQSPVPVILVFASRAPRAYREEHLRLLSNLSLVIALSFGRTLKLVEQGRLAAIGEFASGIAHEIRNPLTTISLALEHIVAQDLPNSTSKRAQIASGEVARMNRLLEDMLLYAKPLRLNLEPMGLTPLLRQVMTTMQSAADKANIDLLLEDNSDGGKVMGDRDRLIQILINLLRNALEAAPENSTITLKIAPVDDVHAFEININNAGEPIAEEHMEKLFEPFYTTKPAGTGLGLPIVRRLIESMGGSIAVSSNKETGTIFRARVPSAGVS